MESQPPELLGIDGGRLQADVLSLAIMLSEVAEGQQGRDPQPDARLAVARCLRSADMHVRRGQHFLLKPVLWSRLAELASRVMADFAAAPQEASAASVLLPPISDFLSAVGTRKPGCAPQLNRVCHSLLASVQQLLEGPSQLLSAAGVAAHGVTLVHEAALSILGAIKIAVWCGCSFTSVVDVSRPAALLLQQCQALLTDSTTVVQLRVPQRYPSCAQTLCSSLTVVQNVVLAAKDASEFVRDFLGCIIDGNSDRNTRISYIAARQQQLQALSAAVACPTFMYGLEVNFALFADLAQATMHSCAALLADVAIKSAEAMHCDPALICQPAGLAATVAVGAASALAFAALDSSGGRPVPGVARDIPGTMQYASKAAHYMHALAQHLIEPACAHAETARQGLATSGAAQSLVRLLSWLSEPTTAVAMASGVLKEALPALRLMATDEEMRQVLAAAGGPYEWKPVAAALRRRLPRRMAARFLPEVDSVSATVAQRAGNLVDSVDGDAVAFAAADAAMAELLLVRVMLHF